MTRASAPSEDTSGAVVLSSARLVSTYFEADAVGAIDYPLVFLTEESWALAALEAHVNTAQVILAVAGKTDVVRLRVPIFVVSAPEVQLGASLPVLRSAPMATVRLVAEVLLEVTP